MADQQEQTVRTAGGEARASGYSWYVLSTLVIVYIFNFIDRQILSILAVDIKRDLALTDGQLGFLGGAAGMMLLLRLSRRAAGRETSS